MIKNNYGNTSKVEMENYSHLISKKKEFIFVVVVVIVTLGCSAT